MKLAVIGYASHPSHPNIAPLNSSLKRHGFPPIEIYGCLGFYPGHHIKLSYLKEALPKLKANGFDTFIALDVFDTLCFNNIDMIQGFDGIGSLLLSGELACWPDPSLEAAYPKRSYSTLWKHVNSGGMMGSIDHTIELMDRYDHRAYNDDQLYWTHVYLKEHARWEECKPWKRSVFIDQECHVFQTTGHCNPWSNFFKPNDDGTITNLQTQSNPVFFHANGGSEYGWLVEHLK